MTAHAGWFPDPAGRPRHYRWWDGSAWTRFLTTDPTVLAPDAGPDPGAATEPTGDPDRAGDPTVVSAETATGRGARPPGYERPPRSDKGRPNSLKAALVGTGAVVLAAAIVLAIVLFGNPAPKALEPPPVPDEPSGLSPSPSPSPTASGKAPDVAFDPVTRMFLLDGLRITLPAAPYAITRPQSTDLGGSSVGARATADVHQNYDSLGNDWAATVDVDQVGPPMRGKTLNQTADKIISVWATSAFGGSKVTIKKEHKTTITKGEPRPARIITADMHYKVKGVRSSYDHVSLLVTKGPSGNYVAFISSRPNDADPKIKKALQDAINTIRLV